MNLHEYSTDKIKLYKKFAIVVKKILATALKKNIHPYRLQQIQTRAKSVESLNKKLAERNLLNSDDIENSIKDLAGCRLIFYHNDDVAIFLRSSIVYDNFEVVEYKPHYNLDGSKKDLYTADHYTIKLKDERIKLPEYSDFKELLCEIQVHTALNNAWSEVAHNITYKKPTLNGIGARQLDTLNSKLNKVMKDYLRAAGYELQKIQRDHQRFLLGKEIFDRKEIEKIGSDINNNDRFDILEKYNEYLLPIYDDISKHLDEIYNIVKTAFIASKEHSTQPIKTPFGGLPGKSPKDILRIGLEILFFIAYMDIDATFNLLIILYSASNETEEKNKISKFAEKLASYRKEIWKNASSYVQSTLINIISAWNKTTLFNFKDVVIAICKSVLSPSIEGQSISFDTTEKITLYTGQVPATEEIKIIWKKSIYILKDIYTNANTYSEKILIIDSIHIASQVNLQIDTHSSEFKMILDNIKDVLNFFKSILSNEQLEIIDKIEHYTYWLSHHYHSHDQRIKILALEIKAILDKLEDHKIYKVFFGYNHIPDDWNINTSIEDYTKKEDKYKEEALKYAESITKENFHKWCERIIKYSNTESEDSGVFAGVSSIRFCSFLVHFGKTSPELALPFLIENNEKITQFITPIVSGILESEKKGEAIRLLNDWVKNDKHLTLCAKIFETNMGLNIKLLKKIYKKAIHLKDSELLTQVTLSAIKNYTENRPSFIKSIFISSIKALTKLECSYWVLNLRDIKCYEALITDLNDKEINVVLANLILITHINHEVEVALSAIAKKSPSVIIDFLGKRFSHKNKTKETNVYEAIPYKFQKLSKYLSTIPDHTIAIVSKWYNTNPNLFDFQGAKLLKNIFSDFSKSLEEELSKLVATNKKKNINIALSILKEYNGNITTHHIYKEIIKVLPNESNLLKKIYLSLYNTGGSWGEFGLANTYEKKRQEILAWLEDENNKVREFAKQYCNDLEKMITQEKRRVEEDLKLRKLQYDTAKDREE